MIDRRKSKVGRPRLSTVSLFWFGILERNCRLEGVPALVVRAIVMLVVFVCICPVRAESDGFSFPMQGRNILPLSEGKRLLHPCSRPAPKHVSVYWEPTEKDIDELDKRILPYLTSIAQSGLALPPAESYDRQYVGIVVKGKKLIYVNLFPPGFRQYDPAHEVIDICDGGPRHWGLVFDPKNKTFSDLSFSNLG